MLSSFYDLDLMLFCGMKSNKLVLTCIISTEFLIYITVLKKQDLKDNDTVK